MAQTGPWMRVVERREHAFSLDVPRGWKVQGGIFRRSAMQVHPLVILTSPGGATKMIIGNTEGFLYAVLTPLGAMMGFREEMPYSPGGDTLWVRQYRTGRVFAEVYGTHRFAEECPNVKLLGSRDRSDAIASHLAPGEIETAGEAFEKAGHKYEGYMFSRTHMTGFPPSQLWNADHSWGFITPAGNGMAAGAVLAHIIGSLQDDPNWAAQQHQTAGAIVQQNLQTLDALRQAQQSMMERTFSSSSTSSSIGSSLRSHQSETQDEISRIISGFDEYTTASGDRKTVQYGAATNWWSNNRGETLGTHGPMSPGVSWMPMQRVPLGER
jgi:hypothetical protein